MTSAERSAALRNGLAAINNVCQELLHQPGTWDDRIKKMQQVGKLIPLIIQCMIFFKNVGTK